MGYRCRWVAMRGRDRADVLARLKLAVKRELNEGVYDTGVYAVDADGWLVVIGDGGDFMDRIERADASRLSDGGEVIFLYTDDTPMRAEITSFVGGEAAWSLTYDGSDGVAAPALSGKLPEVAEGLIAQAREEQEAAGGAESGVDHFYDVVAALGRELVGFRHDETLSAGEHLPILELEDVAR